MHWCLSATNILAELTDVWSVSRHAGKRHHLTHSCCGSYRLLRVSQIVAHGSARTAASSDRFSWSGITKRDRFATDCAEVERAVCLQAERQA